MPSPHPLRRLVHRSALAAGALVACGGPVETPVGDRATPPRDSVLPPASPVRSVRIEPRNIALQAGAAVGFRAAVEAAAGVDTAVRWTAVPEETGRVSQSGVLSSCYPPAMVRLTATSVADSTRRDTLDVAVVIPAVAWATIAGLLPPGESPPTLGAALPDGPVSGDVDLLLQLAPVGIIACRFIERIDVRVRGGGMDTVVTRLEFTPPFRDARQLRARLRSAAVADGTYFVSGDIYLTGLARPAQLLGRTVTIRNRGR